MKIVHLYKPPRASFSGMPIFRHPAIYSGDLNCHHTAWGYRQYDNNGEELFDWSSHANLHFLYNAKLRKTFHSAIWNTYTNPDISFYSHDSTSILLHPTHIVGGNFPKSHYPPSPDRAYTYSANTKVEF